MYHSMFILSVQHLLLMLVMMCTSGCDCEVLSLFNTLIQRTAAGDYETFFCKRENNSYL